MRLAWCVGASACTLASSAFAQGDVAAPRTDIRVTAVTAYEDNVLRISDALPTPVGYARTDIRFAPAITVDIYRPLGRQGLFLNGSVGYDFYKRNKRLERERINLRGGADLRLGGDCAQHVEVGYGRNQSDLRDFFNATRLRNVEERKTFGFSANCNGVIGFKPGVSYDYENAKNSAVQRQQSDYHSHTFGASIGYVSPALGELSVYASYRMGTYPNRAIAPGIVQKEGIDVFNTGLRYSRSLGTRLQGSVSAGFTKVKPKLAGTAPFSGASYSANLTWAATNQLRSFFTAARSVNQSNALDNSYSVNDSFNLGASYAFNETLRANMAAGYVKRRFTDSPLLGPSPFGRNDKSRVLSGGIDYSPPGRISMAFDMSESKKMSPVNLLNYNSFVARFTVRFGI